MSLFCRAISFVFGVLIFSCQEKSGSAEQGNSTATQILLKNETPTVDIEKYTLISHPGDDRTLDASEILHLKRQWPLVMQAPTKTGFDSILSRNFTFMGDGRLLNRDDYIGDRTSVSEWKITHVRYDDVVLQFFGDRALLTYRNRVTNEHVKTGAIETEYISWADMYTKENGKWKIDAAHVVDFKMEPR